jgi:hypothetical protein
MSHHRNHHAFHATQATPTSALSAVTALLAGVLLLAAAITIIDALSTPDAPATAPATSPAIHDLVLTSALAPPVNSQVGLGVRR